MKVLIIGHGFVGKAVDYGFTHPDLKKKIVDIKYGNKHPYYYDEFHQAEVSSYNIVFVCVPTPMQEDGSADTSIVKDVIDKLTNNGRVGTPACPIVLKSTVPPDFIEEIQSDPKNSNVVYSPEFLTEKNANEQFVNPEYHIFGGVKKYTQLVEHYYLNYSLCSPCPTFHCSGVEASLIKYTINSFLATKVTFFNQIYDICKEMGVATSFKSILNGISMDKRIGTSHTKVPGFDNKQGFGGACFPKDTSAFIKFSKRLTLLENVVKINNEYRSKYDLDEREIEQHVNYGQTEEEQQDQD